MEAVKRAGVVYYRANVAAWVALKSALSRAMDVWVLVGLVLLGAVVTLVTQGQDDAALVVGALSLWVLVLQRAASRR